MNIRQLTKVVVVSGHREKGKGPLSGPEALEEAKKRYVDGFPVHIGHASSWCRDIVDFDNSGFDADKFSDACVDIVFSVLSGMPEQNMAWNKVREARSLANYRVSYKELPWCRLAIMSVTNIHTQSVYYADSVFIPSTSSYDEVVEKMKLKERDLLVKILKGDHDFLIKRALKRYMFGKTKAFSVVRGLCREVNLPEKLTGHL